MRAAQSSMLTRSLRLMLFLAIFAANLTPAGASAAPYVLPVTGEQDESLTENEAQCGEIEQCNIRAALEQARSYSKPPGTSITIDVPAGHYSLTKGPLVTGNTLATCEGGVKCPVTIRGAGAGRTVISGAGAGALISVLEGAAPITVEGVTLRKGAPVGVDGGAIAMPFGELTIRESVLTESTVTGARGGAIYMSGGTLNITDSAITGNSASEGGGLYLHRTTLHMLRSSVTGNSASGQGGAIAAVEASGEPVEAVDSTIAGNSSAVSGGGVALTNGSSQGYLRFTTVAGNTAPAAAGVYGNGAQLTIEGSIISGNSSGQCAGFAAVSAVGANIVNGSSACSFANEPLAADPLLGALGANGGLGETMPLRRGSPAVGAAGPLCPGAGLGGPPLDQRGVPRPRGAGCDLGAFESAADAAVSLVPSPDPVSVGGALTLTATAINAGLDPLTGVVLTVPVPSGASLLSAPGGCSATFGSPMTVSCPVGSLAPGQSRGVAISVRPERAGALLESASVSSDQPDTNPANDSATTASVAAQAAGSGPPPQPPTPPPGSPTATLLSRTITVSRKGAASVRISCAGPAGAVCSGAVDLYTAAGTLPAIASGKRPAKAALLARVRLSIRAGATATVHLKLGGPAMKRLPTHAALAARVLLSAGPTRLYRVTVRRGR